MPANYFQPASRYAAGGLRNSFLTRDTFSDTDVYPSYAALSAGTQWNNEQSARATQAKQRQERLAKFGAPPAGVDPDQWYQQKETASQYTPIEVTKNQWLKDFVGGLETDLSKASSTMPDFSTLLSDLKKDQGGIGASFDRYGSAMNLDGYIAAQRGGDAELRDRTGALGADVGAMSGRYDDLLADYERRGTGALDDELANARDFSGRLIPQAITDAYGQVQKNAKLYDFATPGGYSSGLAGKIAGESTRAALPYMLEGSRYTGNVLGKYQPFYGDVAARKAGKITGFDYPAAAAMYDRYGNVIGQEKATAANIQQLQMSVAREGVDMAIKRFVTDFQSAQMLAQAANLPVQVIMERAQAAGVLGGMSPMYQYEGLEGGPAFLQSPTGQNNSLPGYPPSRYGPTAGTGTGAQPAAQPAARNPTSWYDQTQADILRRFGPPRWQTPGTRYERPPAQPGTGWGVVNGQPIGGGWGYSGGEYTGADADAWNENIYGPIVSG